MSIPVSIDPLGTLGAELLPYIQPIMTSATTWSNEPSFGATVKGNVFREEPWVAMDNSNDTFCIFANNTDAYNPNRGVIITLEKPVMLEKLDILWKFEVRNDVLIFGGEADSEVVLISRAELQGARTSELIVPTQKMFKRFRLFCSNPTINYTWLYNIKLTAYYKA